MGLTLGYTAQTLNFYNLHSFFNVRLICCFSFENTNYFNIHTQWEGGEGFKETNSGVHSKGFNFSNI